MDFIDRVRELSSQCARQIEHLQTEEATKNALVMPFIQALGYNVFDPMEVIPEFICDIGTKKGEKVDYAITQDGKPIILIEAKSATAELHINNASQLFRYFTVSEARFAILTNGIEYRFYTDLEKPNTMDSKPFLIFNMLEVDEHLIPELKKFTKSTFNVDHIMSSANELKYKREIRQLIDAEYTSPSDDFIRHFTRQVYSGQIRQSVIEEFSEIVKEAFRDFLNTRIASRLQTAIDSETVTQEPEQAQVEEVETASSEPETTPEELDGFYIVRAILREIVDVDRVTMRDVQSYCGILLDDNNRQPICRLHFNRTQKYLGIFDDNKDETRMPIDSLNDIYDHADALKKSVQNYIAE